MSYQSSAFVLCICFGMWQSPQAQIQFTNQSERLHQNNDFFSGVAVTVTDINGDGRDDIARLQRGKTLQFEIQGTNDNRFFQALPVLAAAQPQWNLIAGDVNNDDRIDFLTAGNNDGVKLLTANSFIIDDYDVSNLPANPFFAQGANFADIDNDGYLDVFVCDDDAISKIWLNDQSGNFIQSDIIDLSTDPPSDNSGNYGSIWSDIDSDGDLDLYIAKCRQNVMDVNDPRRINQLFINNGDGTYTEMAAAFDLDIGAQSWSVDFGDIDNDGDFDCFITNHDFPSMLLENIDNTHFEDITNDAGIAVGGVPLQGVFRDCNNDGFLDILVAGTQSFLYVNNGDKTFEMMLNPFGDIPVHSFGVGDLNDDGFIDVYGIYQELFNQPSNIRSDALWLNSGNENNYIKVYLKGSESNINGVGCRIEIYGEWGMQTREVHAGESYGIMNSLVQHFGLGTEDNVDSMKIYWPSGQVDVHLDIPINATVIVSENGCASPTLELEENEIVRCPGENAMLQALAGYSSYQWSTGQVAESISVGSAGIYHVSMTDEQGCLYISKPVQVVDFDGTEQPALEIFGDTIFCKGGFVELNAPLADQYLWNTGDTSKKITVTTSGEYMVTLTGVCGPLISETITVNVIESFAPLAENDTITAPGMATLSALGDSLFWYNAPAGGQLLGSGDTLVTPHIDETTTFYVENHVYLEGQGFSAGMSEHGGGSAYSGDQFNGGLIFDVSNRFTLQSVEVYTEFYGYRRIILLDSTGAVKRSMDIDIQTDTAVLELGWEILPGVNYMLTTDQQINQDAFGVNSPKLYRSSQTVLYPYTVPGVLSIKNSNYGLQSYYYFYNWQVKMPDLECISDRVPVEAVVDTSSAVYDPALEEKMQVFPNPASVALQIQLDSGLLLAVPRIEILELNGRILKDLRPAEQNILIDISDLPQGAYLIRIEAGNRYATRRFVVHR